MVGVSFRFLLILLMVLNVNLTSAQGTALSLNQLNKKDQKIGKWKVFHENSNQLRYVGQFENDNPIGNFTYVISVAHTSSG